MATTKASEGVIGDASIKTSHLKDGVLSADAAGRLKMANGFVDYTKVAAGMQIGYAKAENAVGVSTGLTIPDDDTIPQNTEGAQYLTVSYTPKDAASLLEVEAVLPFVNSPGGVAVTIALFRDAAADAIAAASFDGALDKRSGLVVRAVVSAVAATATTFKLRFGAASGTARIGNIAGTGRFGAACITTLTVREIKQ